MVKVNLAGVVYQDGMTLRDWFAGQALAGMATVTNDHDQLSWFQKHGAQAAFKAADAMLAARSKS